MNAITRIADITHLILERGISDLSKTKWNKLLFFIDLAYYQSPYNKEKLLLTRAIYRKLPYGPVLDDFDLILNNLQLSYNIHVNTCVGYSSNYISFIVKSNDEYKLCNQYSDEEFAIINKVCEKLGKLSAKKISDFSHQLSPWKNEEMFELIDFKKSYNDAFITKTKTAKTFYEVIME